jgi:glucose-1-phosphate cytidylyltransferase
MEVVILCGGKGTRLKEETEFKPKPMVEVGGIPMVIHVMNVFSNYGFKDFILALGYKGNVIREYFLNWHQMNQDITIDMAQNETTYHRHHKTLDWQVSLIDTGEETLKGGRLKKVSKFITGGQFFVTYGDGVGNIDIKKLIASHNSMGKTGTFTGVHMPSRFGGVRLTEQGEIESWKEKPIHKDYINGGFFLFNSVFLDYLTEDDDCELEGEPLETLAEEKQLNMYQHDGVWYCMDTYRDYEELNSLWYRNQCKWVPD